MRSKRMKGEVARDEKSFAMQQKISKLQLDIMKAEDSQQWEKAQLLKIEKERLERMKQEYDLQTSIAYDPKRRAIEQRFLDAPMTYREIMARITRGQELVGKYGKYKGMVESYGPRIESMGGWFGGGGMTININAGAFAGTPADARRFAKEMLKYIKQEASR